MNCTDFQAEFLAGRMTRAADAHLAGCSNCRSSLTELRSIRSVIEDPSTWEQPSQGLESRVVSDIGALTTTKPAAAKLWPAVVAIAASLLLIAATVAFVIQARPDWTLALEATDVEPTAAATVDGWNTETGTRMRLEVSGLPALASDTYYEIWLTSPDGRHVSAGTFTGSGQVDATIAVRRSEFPRVWITVETNDDDESLSGETVLDTPQ